MLPWISQQTVTRLRAEPGVDGYGDAKPNWSSPDELLISGCSFQPVGGEEVQELRDSVVQRWNWFGPLTADVTPFDRLRVDGVVYDIDGQVNRWVDPTGSGLDHLEASCRRSDG